MDKKEQKQVYASSPYYVLGAVLLFYLHRSFIKNHRKCALHFTRHCFDVMYTYYNRGENMDSSGKDSILHPSSGLTSDVTFSHFLIFLETCILIVKTKQRLTGSVMAAIISAKELYKPQTQ